MLKKIIEKTTTASVIAVGAISVAWIVNKAMIEFFQMKQNGYKTDSMQPDLHPATRRYYEKQAEDFGIIVDSLKKLDPMPTVIRRGRQLYYHYLGRNGQY